MTDKSPFMSAFEAVGAEESVQTSEQQLDLETATKSSSNFMGVFNKLGPTVIPEPPEDSVARDEDVGIIGSFTRGLSSGIAHEKQFLRDAALVARVKGGVGEDYINQKVRESIINQQQIQQEHGAVVDFDEAFSSPGNFVNWLSFATGEQVPTLVTIIAGGGLTGILGRLAVKKTISTQAANAAAKYAASIGAIGTATAIETGATAGEAISAVGEIDPDVALVAGLAKGALEAITPIAIGKAAGILGKDGPEFFRLIDNALDDTRGVVRRGASSALKTGAVESATEALQEAVDVAARIAVDDTYADESEQIKDRIVESAVTAFFVGGGFGGLTSTIAPRRNLESAENIRPAEVQVGDDVVRTTNTKIPNTPEDVVSSDGTVPLEAGPDSLLGIFGTVDNISQAITTPGQREDLSNGTFFIEKSKVGESVGLPVFETDSRVRFGSALAGQRGDPSEFIFLQGTKSLREGDITAPIYAIPQNLDPEDSRISYAKETEQNPFAIVQEALRQYAAGDTATAQELYKNAIDLGFRYKPLPTTGFIPIGGFTADDVVVTSGPSGAQLIDNAPVVPDSDLGGEVIPLTGHGLFEKGIPQTAEYFVDYESIPYDKLTSTNYHELHKEMGIVLSSNLDEVLNDVQGFIDENVIAFTDPENYGPEDFVQDIVELKSLHTHAGEIKFLKMIQDGFRYYGSSDLAHVGPIDPKALISLGDPKAVPFHEEGPSGSKSLGQILRSVIKDSNVFVLPDGRDSKDLSTVVMSMDENDTKYLRSIDVTVAEMEQNRKFVSSLVSELRKQFLPEGKLIVAFVKDEFKGSYVGSQEANTHIITINVLHDNQDVNKKFFQQEIFAHEFGHLLSQQYISDKAKTDPAIIDELFSAYGRARFRAHNLKASIAAPSFISPTVHLRHGVSISGTPGDAQMGKNLEQVLMSNDSADYYLSFEEWIAEEMSKWVSQDKHLRPPLGKLEKILNEIKNLINTLFKTVHIFQGKKAREYEATTEFELFLDYIRNDTNPDTSIYDQLTDLRNGRASWIRELGITIEPGHQSGLARRMLSSKHIAPAMRAVKVANGNTLDKEIETIATASDYFNSMVKYGWNVIQLAWKNRHIKPLQEYVSIADLWQNEKMTWTSRASATLRDWGSIGKENADKLSAFIFDVDAMVYLKGDEAPRQPTSEELQTLVNKHGLNEGTYQLFLRIRSDFDAILDRLELIIKDNIRKNTDPASVTMLLEMARIDQEFSNLRNRPYFPHSRFGDYSVVVSKGSEVVHMEQVEGSKLSDAIGKTPKAVRRAQAELKKRFPASDGFQVGIAKIPEQAKVFRGIPPSILQMIKTNLSSSLSKEQMIWLDRLIIELAPAQSFRKRLSNRQNVPGYSRDAMRSYADYFWHASNHMARISYGQDMQEIIDGFRKEISRLLRNGFDVSKRVKMADFLQDHLENILNPQPDWAQLRSAAFSWWLGFVPASAALNFTQLPIAAVPYLSSRFGDIATLGAFRRAATSLNKTYRDPLKNIDKISSDDAHLFDLAFRQGFIEESLAMELAGVAEGSNLVRIRHGSKMQRILTGFSEASGWMFQASEKINRRITFQAAVDLARKKPNSKYLQDLKAHMNNEYFSLKNVEGLSEIETLAFLAGKDAVRRTQFEYSAWARPAFMRGRKGVIFTFFMFLQNMMWFVFNSPGNTRMLLTMAAMGGLMALPGSEDLFAVINFIGRKLYGNGFNLEHDIRDTLTELFGDNQTADLFLHGAGREGFGLPAAADAVGIPFPEFDMSAAVGMGRVVPGLQSLTKLGSESFEESLGRTTQDIAGASIGIGLNFFKFLTDNQLPIDDMKRWERTMPRALKNVSKAARYTPPDSNVAALTGNFVEPEGRERSRTGDTIVAFDGDNPEHMMEIAMQAMGFNPTRLSREWDARIAQMEVVNFWRLRRSMLMNQFWHTMYTNDPDGRKDVRKAIAKFNKDVPYGNMAITGKSLKSSVERRIQIRRLREAGVEPTKMFRGVARDTRQLFPNKTDDVILEEKLPSGN